MTARHRGAFLLQRIEVQEQLRQTAVADRVGEAQVHRQRHDIHAERRAVFQARRYRRQGDAAAARAMSGIAFHSGHHGAHHRQVDLVVTTMQHLIRIAQRGLTMRTRYRLGGHRLVGIAGQRSAAPFASHAALARPDAFGFLRLVRFLPLRRRQARIVRGLRWFVALASSTAIRVVRLCTCAHSARIRASFSA